MASDKPITDIDFRLLLIGRTGHGKSETGNTLLNTKAFISRSSTKSVTKESDWKAAENDGKMIEIVDTPGLKDTVVDEAAIKTELYRALIFSAPGFHAIALVIKPDRFTPEMKQVVDVFFDFFGNDVEKYAFVIFTHTDTQSGLMEFLELHDGDCEQPPDTDLSDCIVDDKFRAALTNNGYKMDKSMKEMIDKCGGNVAIINNKGSEEQKQLQVNAILDAIHTIKLRSGHTYFTNAKFLSIDLMIEIENKKASQSKEQDIRHVPWSWVKSGNNTDVLEKVLQDAMNKGKTNDEKRERERRAFEEQQSARANAFEEQLKKERDDRERERKVWEERQREINENMKQEHERMQAMKNEHERDIQKQELQQRERELQMLLEERRKREDERDRREHEKREHDLRARERERLEFENKMASDLEKTRLELEIQRIQHQADLNSLKAETAKNKGGCILM